MGERRVLIVIDPPEPLRCGGCRWQRYVGPIFRRESFCNLHFEVDPLVDVRPTACIAAEAGAAKFAEDAEWACENRVQICDVEGCDAEVTCGWPTGDGYRQTCSRHYLDGLPFMAAPRQPEKRDRVADALAAVLGPEPVEL